MFGESITRRRSRFRGPKARARSFFSPDGAWIGFRAGQRDQEGAGRRRAVRHGRDVPAGGSLGTSWGEDGTIFFASVAGIFRVSSAGGTPTTVTTPDAAKRERHLLPQSLPGGNALLFTDRNLQGLGHGERRSAVARHRRAARPHSRRRRRPLRQHGAPCLYMRTGTFMAVPFDVRSRQVTGTPVTLVEGVMQGLNALSGAVETGAGQFTVALRDPALRARWHQSDSGKLVGMGR